MIVSKSSALFMNVLLISHNINGALVLRAIVLSVRLFAWVLSAVILPFTTIFPSLWPHKSDFNIGLSNLIFLFTEYCLSHK